MKAWERERRLLERLQEQGSLALTEACALTGASVATTRRDFELLQEKGLAQRTHGGLGRNVMSRRAICRERRS